jgi:hypothetical protein
MHMYKQTVIVQTTQYETWYENVLTKKTWTQTHVTAARACTERARQHTSTTHHDSPASIDTTCADGVWNKNILRFYSFQSRIRGLSVVKYTAFHARVSSCTHTHKFTHIIDAHTPHREESNREPSLALRPAKVMAWFVEAV